MIKTLSWILVVCLSAGAPTALAATPEAPPKKLLVVSVSTRNRFQGSIDVAEKALVRLAGQSRAFTLEFVRQPTAGQPRKPKPPAALKPGASVAAQAEFVKTEADYKTAAAAYPEAEKRFQDELKQALQKLSPESLKNYDAIVFCYTTGDLPLPDTEGFLAWIKAGHAFIGFGSANETMVRCPSYFDMLGGKWTHFTGPGAQEWTEIEIVNPDPQHPANRGIPTRWPVKEFSYKIPNFVLSDPAHTQELLILDKSPTTGKAPGHFPLAWGHTYGQGRVFYTALGGNLDLWDPELANRKNPPETARVFQAHLLGGILWALGLDPAGTDSPTQHPETLQATP